MLMFCCGHVVLEAGMYGSLGLKPLGLAAVSGRFLERLGLVSI